MPTLGGISLFAGVKMNKFYKISKSGTDDYPVDYVGWFCSHLWFKEHISKTKRTVIDVVSGLYYSNLHGNHHGGVCVDIKGGYDRHINIYYEDEL